MPTKNRVHSISTMGKWSLGCVSFFLPVLVALAGKRFDHSAYRHDATFKALIPFVAFGSLALALAVPVFFLLTCHWPVARRVAAVLGVVGLLSAEIICLFFYVTATT